MERRRRRTSHDLDNAIKSANESENDLLAARKNRADRDRGHRDRGQQVGVCGGALHVEVADDGIGGAVETPGSGLEGLRDRLEALGGNLSVNSASTAGTQVAATILHEAMHARLDNAGVKYESTSAAKHERFCRRAEVEFGMLAPDGKAVVERALASLASADEEVAPVVDWELAGRRVAEADIRALSAPEWMKRALSKQAGLDPMSGDT